MTDLMHLKIDPDDFERAFKPWVKEEILRHAEQLVRELTEDFKRKLCQLAAECIAKTTIQLNASGPNDFTVHLLLNEAPTDD